MEINKEILGKFFKQKFDELLPVALLSVGFLIFVKVLQLSIPALVWFFGFLIDFYELEFGEDSGSMVAFGMGYMLLAAVLFIVFISILLWLNKNWRKANGAVFCDYCGDEIKDSTMHEKNKKEFKENQNKVCIVKEVSRESTKNKTKRKL